MLRVHGPLSNKNRIRVLAGDRVLVEITAYDVSLA
jgi:translation initiation factor IF-1